MKAIRSNETPTFDPKTIDITQMLRIMQRAALDTALTTLLFAVYSAWLIFLHLSNNWLTRDGGTLVGIGWFIWLVFGVATFYQYRPWFATGNIDYQAGVYDWLRENYRYIKRSPHYPHLWRLFRKWYCQQNLPLVFERTATYHRQIIFLWKKVVEEAENEKVLAFIKRKPGKNAPQG